MARAKGISPIQSSDPVVNRMNAQIAQAVDPLLKANLAKFVSVPTAADAQGTTGQIAVDSSFLYICVAPNSWVRAAVGSW